MSVGSVSLPRVTPRVQEVAWRGTLAGSALWLFSSNLLYAGCQWATVVGLAKLGTPAPLGHLGLALADATLCLRRLPEPSPGREPLRRGHHRPRGALRSHGACGRGDPRPDRSGEAR